VSSEKSLSSLSASQEMYLKTIYKLCQEQKVARVKDIAGQLQVTMSSVNGAIKHLVAMGLCEHGHYGYVDLTPNGTHLAKDILGRYQTLARFLIDHLGVSIDVADSDACEMEHIISPQTLDRIATWQQFIKSLGKEGEEYRQRYQDFLNNELNES
jgi:DtxR family transcriptional regulator, Mn-dependent transcriptional regulator